MIELRWKLEFDWVGKADAKWTLQYRYSLTPEITTPDDTVWSDWIDVPYFSEQ